MVSLIGEIIIHIQLHTTMQQKTSSGLVRKMDVCLAEGSRMSDLLDYLNITSEIEHTLFVVNGKLVDQRYIFKNRDEVHLIPAISGGSLTQT
jgi:sulfur carrier protein ThiS